ncbi:MAG TPA: VOC family protein [Thermoplasmata archaeon]|nr:VOC family protein [Thermoplasmata archaeon]
MRIWLTSVFVQDQAKALKFYTEVLGFVKKSDVSLGKYRWLTVVSPDDPRGGELLLEPDEKPVAKAFQAGIREQGIPAAMFQVKDIEAEVSKLKARGARFTREIMKTPGSSIAILDDTCGNLIQLVQLG